MAKYVREKQPQADFEPSKVPIVMEDLYDVGDVEPLVQEQPVEIVVPQSQNNLLVKTPRLQTDEIIPLEEENLIRLKSQLPPETLGKEAGSNQVSNNQVSNNQVSEPTESFDDLIAQLEDLREGFDLNKNNMSQITKRELNREELVLVKKLEKFPSQWAKYRFSQRATSIKDSVGRGLTTVGGEVKALGGDIKSGLGYGGSAYSEEEYARIGGYKGSDKSTLDLHINSIDEKLMNIENRKKTASEDFVNANAGIESSTKRIIEIQNELKETSDPEKINKLNAEIRIEENKINSNKRERDDKGKELVKLGNDRIDALDSKSKYEIKRNEFYAYKEKGLKDYQKERGFAHRASKYGIAAQESVNNVFTPPGGKGILAKDWYGSKGFMSQPFNRQSITTSPLEPVRTKLSNLDALTRSTGSSVGRDMVNSIVNIRKGNVIAPLGVPGTIGRSGISDRYNYNTPLKKIQVSDVYTNVNRDFLPSIMEKKVAPLQMQQNPRPIQYQQMVQPDGTVINVPVQQRKHKKANPVNRMNIGINNIVQSTGKSKPQVDKKSTAIDNIVNNINKIGTVKPNKDVIPKKKRSVNMFTVKNYDFGISLNKKPEVQIEVIEPKERKPKTVDPIVNILSNINNMTKKKKKV